MNIRQKYFAIYEQADKLRELNNITISDVFKLFKYFQENIYDMNLVRYDTDNFIKIFSKVTGKRVRGSNILKSLSFVASDEQERLSARSWLLLMALLLNSSKEEKLNACFQIVDEDRDGYISFTEVSRILQMSMNMGLLKDNNIFKASSWFDSDVKLKSVSEFAGELLISTTGTVESQVSASQFVKFPLDI